MSRLAIDLAYERGESCPHCQGVLVVAIADIASLVLLVRAVVDETLSLKSVSKAIVSLTSVR